MKSTVERSMNSATDTIFAQSSAIGRSAISVHRISGPACLQKLNHLLRAVTKTPENEWIPGSELRLMHGRSLYGFILDTDQSVIDDCLVSFFQAPLSYTGEDTLELSCHGNPLITSRLHSLLRKIGCRDALPGEFTQRAFLNGKLDLTRAEAIDQLIHAESAAGLELARNATCGSINKFSHTIRNRLITVMSYFEAHIDFAEDEIGNYSADTQTHELNLICNELLQLRDSYSSGLKIRDGQKVVFIGEPNAGKSSLYNSLLGAERAIVTDIPGTTRDVVEDKLRLQGHEFVISDTAGIRDTNDTVEKIGVSRSLASATNADILCYLIDPTKLSIESFETELQDGLSRLQTGLSKSIKPLEIIVFTKSDSWNTDMKNCVQAATAARLQQGLACVATSSQTEQNIDLINALIEMSVSLLNRGSAGHVPILISKRQQDKTNLAIESLTEALRLIQENDYPEKIASLLIATTQHLSDVIGEVGNEDILTNIFSNFCIGK